MSASRTYRPAHGGRPDATPALSILGRRFADAIRRTLEDGAARCNELIAELETDDPVELERRRELVEGDWPR